MEKILIKIGRIGKQREAKFYSVGNKNDLKLDNQERCIDWEFLIVAVKEKFVVWQSFNKYCNFLTVDSFGYLFVKLSMFLYFTYTPLPCVR